ncbi:MAG: hypothetical protein K0Q99_2230 [Clostridia bacterium]|jgi:hypothetical protein|nr:hypothetical protein [Clostridia bacterium]
MQYVIDRFEGRYAVCEDEQGNMLHIERVRIPIGAKEGDVIFVSDTGVEIDLEVTKKRKANIEALAKELWKDEE